MARNSGWQDFAKNFQSMYGLAKDIGQESDLEDIMNEKAVETFDDAGLSTGWTYGDKTYKDEITPDMLRGLQSDRTADVYTKWGNAEKALEIRTKQADLQERRNQNKLFQDTYQTKIDTLTAELKGLRGRNEGQDNTNIVNKAVGKVTISQAEMDAQHNKWLIEYSTKEPEEGKKFLEEKCKSTAGNSVFCDTIKATNAFELHKKANVGAQLMGSVQAALGKGQAGGQEELMALIDAQDGITGNIRFNTDPESGAVSIVELDQEGNPTNAAPWAGKNWEDFSQNVMKRLDPVNAISITSKQVGVEKDEASVGLINAQTVETISKAAGGNQEKMELLITEEVGKFTREVGGKYYQAKTDAERKRVLDIYKHELRNALNQRNKKGGYNQPKSAPASAPGGDGAKVLNLNNTVDGAPVVGEGEGEGEGDGDGAGDGGLKKKWTRDQSAAGGSGFTKQQVDTTASLNTQAKQKKMANAEIGNRVHGIRTMLRKDLVPFTLDSNLPAADYKAQKLRDETLEWLNKNNSYFLRKENINKLTAFEKNPGDWYLKNIKALKNKKGLK